MRVLAIHSGHNATVALLDDGNALGVLSQEKMDSRKNSAAFPMDAARLLLAREGWTPADVEAVAIAGNVVYPSASYDYLFTRRQQVRSSAPISLGRAVEKSWAGRVFPFVFAGLRRLRQRQLIREGRKELAKNLASMGLGDKPVFHIDHHECHARAAYHALEDPNATEPALVLTLDGSGDGLCSTVNIGRPGGHLDRIASTPQSSSLGAIYASTTRFLGMKILEHEYKVMGLAAYAKGHHLDLYERVFAPTIDLDPKEPLRFQASFDTGAFFRHLEKNAVGERFDNIAAAAQHLLEDRVTRWVRAAIARTGIRRVFTGGGVFMNVKLNKRIQEMPEVAEARFLPSCGDESNPLGAGYVATLRAGKVVRPLRDLYLGPAYSPRELEAFLRDEPKHGDLEFERPRDIPTRVAALLAKGEVVARFDGRCEFGARALGNRSILAHPSRMESFFTVNDLIKSRDFWMPFAPTILSDWAPKYLQGYDPKRVRPSYMITAYDATPLARQDLRAALHQGDHTLRPQVLERSMNPDYHRIIKEFLKLTGVGAVLNTSLNLHGSPLVATPAQAMATFRGSGLSRLVMGPFLVTKKGSSTLSRVRPAAVPRPRGKRIVR